MRHLLVICLFCLSCSTGQAQNDLRYNLSKYTHPLSTSYNDADANHSDLENAERYLFRLHSTLVNWLNGQDTINHRERNMLSTSFVMQHLTGDYLHTEGNRNTSADVVAGGDMRIKGLGTLYGQVAYRRQKQRNVYFNYTTRPDDYTPYLVSDTVSVDDIYNEWYTIEGGLGARKKHFHYGISGFYEGIATAKETQPRRAVYSYWFRLAMNMAQINNRWLWSVRLYPEINKQSISVSSAVSTYRFLQSYGFGQWNRKESTSGYNYHRQYKILGAGSDATFHLLPTFNGGNEATLYLSYNYRWMQSEETSFKNLYATKSHHLSHQLHAKKTLGKLVDLYFQLDGQTTFRQGEENIYENKKVNQEQSLYDYVQVGTNHLFHHNEQTEHLQLKAIWKASTSHAWGIHGGSVFYRYEDRYDMPKLKTATSALAHHIGLNYQLTLPKDQLDCNMSVSVRHPLEHRYEIPLEHTHLEKAQAYIPYRLRSEHHWQTRVSLIYAHAIGTSDQIGFEFDATYLKRTSLADTTNLYNTLPDRRHALNLQVKLFYLF